MKIKMFVASLAVALMSAANAGVVVDVPVEIDFDEQFAAGNMLTARYSKNESEQIGCGMRTYAATPEGAPAFTFGFCQARISEEESVICYTFDNAELTQQIQSLADNSFVTFRWDENNDCTYIGSSTQSQYIMFSKDEKKARKKRDKDN
ncbi:MAG: hypothetical protein HWE27_13750 [Gammaproteobacteria bacterium]|nr:hypothetical protein [Gammaproteobacteria bacterium]